MGPLAGIKIVELAGIGPGPFCAMLLADMGAEVVRVDRAANVGTDTDRDGNDARFNLLTRGRRNIAVDLKNKDGVEAVLRLIDQADALVEGFRPGVMERLGLGPDVCLARHKRVVYGRMTGWGPGRADARLGPGRPDRPYRRPRHQLHRAVRGAGGDRHGGRAAGAALEPGRRFRR